MMLQRRRYGARVRAVRVPILLTYLFFNQKRLKINQKEPISWQMIDDFHLGEGLHAMQGTSENVSYLPKKWRWRPLA